MSQDEYAPALDTPESAEADGDPNDAPDAAASPKETGEPAEPRRQSRVINDKVKAMFRAIHDKHGDDLEVGDLVPAVEDTKPAHPAKVAAAEAEAAELEPVDTDTPAAKPAAVVAKPEVAAKPDAALIVERASLERERAAHAAAREAFERDRAAFDAERKAWDEQAKKRPDRTAWIERPGATMMEHLRELYGTTDESELKDVLTDLVTEISEQGLGVKLPPDIKTAMESRKAVRAVKAYKADLTREQQRIAEQRAKAEADAKAAREAAEAAANERQALEKVSGLVKQHADSFPFLHEQTDPASIVWEVIKEQHTRAPDQPVDWRAAAQLAEDYFKTQAEETVRKAERLRPKLNPTAPATAPARAAATASPGAAPGPAAKPQPKPAPEPETTATIDEESLQPMDRHERRAAQARALLRKHQARVGA